MSFSRTIEFWQVEEGHEGLDTTLNAFYQGRVTNPADATKVLAPQGQNEVFYLHRFSQNSNYVDGMIVKQRMNDIPKKGKWRTNTLEDFTLEQDSGFAESTYFVYIPAIKVLALVPGRYGVKIGWFSEYIKKTVSVRNFKVSIILTRNAIERLGNLGMVSAVGYGIKVANGYPRNSAMIKSRSLMDMMKANGRYLTVRHEIRSPSKRGGGLKVGVARALVNQLLGNKDNSEKISLEELWIKGSEGPNQTEGYIDILEERYQMKVSLQNGYALDYSECQNRIAPVVLQQRNILEGLLGDVR